MPLASLGDDISSFFNAVGKFFSSLADIHFGALLIALIAFGTYLTIRSRAAFHILRAAYPQEQTGGRVLKDRRLSRLLK